MTKKMLLIGILSAGLMACGGNPATNTNSDVVIGGGNTFNIANTVNSNINPNANLTNVNTKPAADNSPKRISFGKGSNWGTATVTLAPNAVQLFVINAKSEQVMEVESSSKDIAINLRKGKAETTEDFGFLHAELQSNGDYVFEVQNTSKKEVKASIKVTIEGGKTKTEKTEENSDDDSPESNKDDN